MVSAKISFGSEIRRFTVDSSDKWADIELRIRSMFLVAPHEHLHVTYEDSDGDKITISSDLELAEAIGNEANGTLRFALDADTVQTSPDAVAQTTAAPAAVAEPHTTAAPAAKGRGTQVEAVPTPAVAPPTLPVRAEHVSSKAEPRPATTYPQQVEPQATAPAHEEKASGEAPATDEPVRAVEESDAATSQDAAPQLEPPVVDNDPNSKYIHWGVTCDFCNRYTITF